MGDLSKAGIGRESVCAKPFTSNEQKIDTVNTIFRITKGSDRKNSLSYYDAVSSSIRCFAKILIAGINAL